MLRRAVTRKRYTGWGKGGETPLYCLQSQLRRMVMSFDTQHFENLLQQAREQADQAVAQGDAQLQHAAFLTLLEAVRQLGTTTGDWRRMVARATEDFQHDEGI